MIVAGAVLVAYAAVCGLMLADIDRLLRVWRGR